MRWLRLEEEVEEEVEAVAIPSEGGGEGGDTKDD
jgi:hypothetical protein